jgi:hypothetical protein
MILVRTNHLYLRVGCHSFCLMVLRVSAIDGCLYMP